MITLSLFTLRSLRDLVFLD